MSKPQIHQELINAVDNYIEARAAAEIMREKVDHIADKILADGEYFTESRGRRTTSGGERITEHKKAWLMNDADHRKFLNELDARERAVNIKPPEMDIDICPALSAETVLRDAQHAVHGRPLT